MADKIKNLLDPIKDIPKVLKTFPKGLIRLWKDPVKNSEEVAKRKQDLKAWLYVFVPLALLMSILGSAIKAISSITSIFMIIGFIGAVYCGFLLFIANKAAKKFGDLECEKCKTRIPYSNEVDYKVLNTVYNVKKEKTSNSGGGMNVKVTGTERVTVEMNCKCPNCGTPKTFKQEFRTVVCERFETRVSALQADAVMLSFEKDVRQEQKNGFDGSTGATIRGLKSVEELVQGYFGDTIQVG